LARKVGWLYGPEPLRFQSDEGGILMRKYLFSLAILLVFCTGIVAADEVDVLIKQLKSSNSDERLAAAKELGDKKDPRGVSSLVSVLRTDKKWEVRLAAEDSLVKIGSPSAEALLKVIREEQTCMPRRRAARALTEIHDPCSAETLMKASAEDPDCCVRKFAARALGEINDPKAAKYLDAAMKRKNLEIVSGAYRYYIRKGEHGTEDFLVEAMQKCFYDKTMVLDFVGCENEKLKQAAEKIATDHGYALTPDWSGPKWGKT